MVLIPVAGRQSRSDQPHRGGHVPTFQRWWGQEYKKIRKIILGNIHICTFI